MINNKKNNLLLKLAYIRKLPNGKYRVLSEKGKNLGTFKSKSLAEKRLKQVEYFKYLDKLDDDDQSTIDLTKADNLSYSSIVRELRKEGSEEQFLDFIKLYKNKFDEAVKENLQKPELVALQNSLVEFNKHHKIKLSSKITKNAAITELQNADLVGRYLADIVRFTISRISKDKQSDAINSLKNKIYNLNEFEISDKKMPPSASMGQSITFIKHILFKHDAKYIRDVLNSIVKNL